MSRQTFGSLFTLSGTQMSQWASRKIYRITTLNSHHYKSFQEDKHLSHFMFLPVRLVPSSHYIVLSLIHVFWLVRREMWLSISKNFFGWLTQPWNDQKLSQTYFESYRQIFRKLIITIKQWKLQFKKCCLLSSRVITWDDKFFISINNSCSTRNNKIFTNIPEKGKLGKV